MLRSFLLFLLLTPLMYSCASGESRLFSKKTPHELYGEKLREAGLKETALGQAWFAAAEAALSSGQTVKLPYQEVGYFAAERPRAVGLRFTGTKGEQIRIELKQNPVTNFRLYLELWQVDASGKTQYLEAPDSTSSMLQYEVRESGDYLIRLQPELLRSGEYTLLITSGPSLKFPVPGPAARIGSIWGDPRDAGARQHEGIDIFAPKRTPAVAAAQGTVTRVGETGIGGKVVWLRPSGRNYSLYYAHLDEQLVTSGQEVNEGDTLGLVGNTGNARTTPPHLHFGIYALGGAVNPLPFVKRAAAKPTPLKVDAEELNVPLRLSRSMVLESTQESRSEKSHTLVYPVAAVSGGYRVELPDGFGATISTGAAEVLKKPLRLVRLKGSLFLLDRPQKEAPKIRELPGASEIRVLAYFDDFAYVAADSVRGWVEASKLP